VGWVWLGRLADSVEMKVRKEKHWHLVGFGYRNVGLAMKILVRRVIFEEEDKLLVRG
jgi:hypothetical protein